MCSNIHIPDDDWNSHWDHYAESASENPAQEYRHKLISRLIKGKFKNTEINILDVGSGQGDLLSMLAATYPRANLMGFELSKSGVEIAKKKVPKAKFFEIDMLNQSSEINKYYAWADIACCSEVLEHTDHPDIFLKNIFHFIAPGGIIIVTVPGGPISTFDRFIGHRQHFSADKLRDLFIGYKTPSILKAGFPFHNLYKLIIILRGNKLRYDINVSHSGFSKYIAKALMSLFRILFRFNLSNTPFGWQIIGISTKWDG